MKLVISLAIMLVSCTNIAVHQITGRGDTGQGGYEKSSDTQSQSDVSTDMASRISGIDKSNQEITKNLDKQNQMLKTSRERDRAVDINKRDADK